MKVYATGAPASSGFYTGWLGVAVYTHVDAPITGTYANAQNMNGYPNILIGSGVLTLTAERVNSCI